MVATSKWNEIRVNYYDEFEEKWFVDAWRTADDNEEGRVIAKINPSNGRVEYLDADARIDAYAQEVITRAYNAYINY